MTDEELRELRQLLLTTSAFGMKAAMVKWISSILERRLVAEMSVGQTANDSKAVEQSRRDMQRVAKASVAVTRSGFRKAVK